MSTSQSDEGHQTCEVKAGQAPGHVQEGAGVVLVEKKRERLGHHVSGARLVVRHG